MFDPKRSTNPKSACAARREISQETENQNEKDRLFDNAGLFVRR